MKKITLILIALALFTGLNAQVRWGIKAGGNISKVSMKVDSEKVNGIGTRFGFHFGGVMEYSFDPSFAIQPELLFMNNGSSIKEGEEKGNIKLNQIQVPINLKYKVGTDDLKFFATAGPYFSYILSAKLGVENDMTSVDINLYSNGSEMKRLDFGVGAGIGVEVRKTTFGLGYQYGIANLTGTDNASFKLGTFQFSVGYFF